MINWRQLYTESQSLRPEDTRVSTERICRLVNIYKNDLIERDLQRYSQRLSIIARSCQTCTSNSYTTYKWSETCISGDKNLFDFRSSGRAVSPLTYYWKKTLLEQCDERGQPSDFQRKEAVSIPLLSNVDENTTIRKPFYISMLPTFIHQWITRFQMFYTYRKARKLSPSIQVHIQPMKTLRSLFQTNISPIFICFINESNDLPQLFWTFRHLITIFNWPSTTKIFSNRPFPTDVTFERTMANHLGFVDFSSLNIGQTDLFGYLYRCLKTCHRNGPIILLLNHSTVSTPSSSDYCLMSFLCDLLRFDLSVPDLLLIPTRLSKSYLSFSQPFLFKELLEFFDRKINIQKHVCQSIKIEEEKKIRRLIDCLFLHFAYDVNQLVSTTVEFPHIIASIELCQMPVSMPSTTTTIFNTLQTILQTCPFIIADNHQWNEITREYIEENYSKFDHMDSKSGLVSVVRKEYFLDILVALAILSSIQHTDQFSRVIELEMWDQMTFVLYTFRDQRHSNIRSCQSVNQILQQTIQHCQLRAYIPTECMLQKAMAFRDTILSDHDWSDDDDDDGIDDEFVDHDEEDEIIVSGLSNGMVEKTKPCYRINYREHQWQLKFFAKLFGPYIEAIVCVLKHHIEKQLIVLSLNGFNTDQPFFFRETVLIISDDILSMIRRAYSYRSLENTKMLDEIPLLLVPMDDEINSLSMDRLVSLQEEFVKLLNCCCF